MRLDNQKPSKNFIDDTGPPSFLDMIGFWLLKNGWVNNAAGKPYIPPGQGFDRMKLPPPRQAPGDWPTQAPIKR